MAIAFLNGDWMQPEEAKVSVFDRGYVRNGVYEVMPVYGGRLYPPGAMSSGYFALSRKSGWKRPITTRLGQH